MQAIDYQTYNAHAKQRAFHKAVRANEYVLFNGGRGSGKTTSGAIQSVLEATVYQPGKRGVVVAPTYSMLEDASMHEFFAWLPRHWIRSFNKTRKVLELLNDTEIAFRSADDPESLRGPNRAWAWLDEPRNLKTREAFDTVTAQLRPTIKCWLTTTPSGIFHWIYDLFIAKPLPLSQTITVRTNENPFVPPAFENRLREQYTDDYAAQELDAQWVTFEGLIYDNFVNADGGNVSVEAEFNPAWDTYWGYDDGYAYGQGPGHASYHPRVVLIGQYTPIGGLNISHEYYRTGVSSYEPTITDVRALPCKEPEAAYGDSSAAMLAGALRDADIFAKGVTHPVSEGIKNLRRLICDGNGVRLLKIHPRCKNLIREMQSYRRSESEIAQGGEIKPLKIDDHGPDCLRYLAWPLRYEQ